MRRLLATDCRRVLFTSEDTHTETSAVFLYEAQEWARWMWQMLRLATGKSCVRVLCWGRVRSNKHGYYQKVVNYHLDCFAQSSSCHLQLLPICNLLSNAFPQFFSTTVQSLMARYAKRLLWVEMVFRQICCLVMNQL